MKFIHSYSLSCLMKNKNRSLIRYSILLGLLLILLLPSCSKDEGVGSALGIERGTISANINGNQFVGVNSVGIISTVVDYDFFTMGGAEVVGGINTEALLFSFFIPTGESIEEVTYNFEKDSCQQLTTETCGFISYIFTNNTQTSELSYSSAFEEGRCTIKFSSIDYRPGGGAIGEFSGTVVSDDGEMLRVTDGKFNVDIN